MIYRAGCGCLFVPLENMGKVRTQDAASKFPVLIIQDCGGDEDFGFRYVRGRIKLENLCSAAPALIDDVELVATRIGALISSGVKYSKIVELLGIDFEKENRN